MLQFREISKEGITLSERSQMQKNTHDMYDSMYIKYSEKVNLWETESRLEVSQG